MDYVCHKVGLLFPFCEACESYSDCEKEATPPKTTGAIPVAQTTAEAYRQ